MSLKILITDDNNINGEVLFRLIKKYDDTMLVDIAESGYEALHYVYTGKTYDLVFMDFNLPGIDGITTAEHIKSINPKTEIIGATAFVDPNIIQACLNSGMTSVLLKPIHIKELESVLKKHNNLINARI